MAGLDLIFLFSNLEGLRVILEELSGISQKENLSHYIHKLQTALAVCEDIKRGLNTVRDDYSAVTAELGQYQRDPHEIIDENRFSYIEKYRQIHAAGGSPALIHRIATMDGVTDELMHIKILRSLFNISIEQAREIIIASK